MSDDMHVFRLRVKICMLHIKIFLFNTTNTMKKSMKNNIIFTKMNIDQISNIRITLIFQELDENLIKRTQYALIKILIFPILTLNIC